ncbi:MAG: sulfite reductase, partial [Verrucomicrobiota bacterium]
MIETAPVSASPAKPLTRNEGLKAAHPLLEGTIAQTLADPAAERFSEDDYEFLKFHGIYQQDDRDQR